MSDWKWWEQFTWGYRTPSPWYDIIKVVSVEDRAPDTIEFALTSAPVIEWYKAIQVVDSPGWYGTAWTNRDDHGPRSIIIQYIPVFVDNAALEFIRTGWFGIATGVYKVGDLKRYNGKKVTLDWQWDWGGDETRGYTVPENPTPPVPGA
jgi:hypothetical protein